MIQNLVWATAYNLVAIPVAAGVFSGRGAEQALHSLGTQDHQDRVYERCLAHPRSSSDDHDPVSEDGFQRLVLAGVRAAKRLTQTTGMEAKTIHRLLEIDPGTGRFSRDESNPLACELLVVDETSMVDVLLPARLGRARTRECISSAGDSIFP
jgi:AAA domain